MIQYNEYYPFGLQTSTSWTRENTKDNNYLYNAANELNKTSGWYEMFYRGYDPAIGRMLQVDPYAPMYASSTTYNYALNNPVMMNDPGGGQIETPVTFSQMGWDRQEQIKVHEWWGSAGPADRWTDIWEYAPIGANVGMGSHNILTIDVMSFGPSEAASHIITEHFIETMGGYSASGTVWNEYKKTTTKQMVIDQNGNLISSSKVISSSNVSYGLVKLYTQDSWMYALGQQLSHKSSSKIYDDIGETSSEFKDIVAMVADYSRRTNGLSITRLRSNFATEMLSRTSDENGSMDPYGMIGVSFPALWESDRATFFKSIDGVINQCAIHDDEYKWRTMGTAGYIKTGSK